MTTRPLPIAPRVAFVVILAVGYVLVWRPVRVWLAQDVIRPVTEQKARGNERLADPAFSGTGPQWEMRLGRESDTVRAATYTAPLGFWLFAGIGVLILLGYGIRPQLLYLGLHLVLGILALGLLLAGISVSTAALMLQDVMTRYITPAASLTVMALAMMAERRRGHARG